MARELGSPAGGRKEDIIQAILAATATDAAGGAEDMDADLADDIVEGTGSAGAPAGDPTAPPAAEGKHAAIVFALEKQQVWAILQGAVSCITA